VFTVDLLGPLIAERLGLWQCSPSICWGRL